MRQSWFCYFFNIFYCFLKNLSNQISNMESKIKELTEDKTIQMNKMKTLANEVIFLII